MEVHAHTHTPRKKWTHYFWEFLMLFLAVFCGFLAEYKLEHIIEHNKEKEYMRSMIEDLRQDTAEINSAIFSINTINIKLDTLLNLLEYLPIEDSNDRKKAYKIHFAYLGATLVTFSQRTLSQLKNSGGLRLIRKKDVADTISLYDSKIQYLNAISNSYDEASTIAGRTGALLFDIQHVRRKYQKSNINFLTNNIVTFKEYSNHIFSFQGIGRYYLNYLKRQKELAEQLISLIKKEYHLK